MEVLRTAFEALRRHLMRSFLTLLGVIIGVMTIISVVSVIAGLNDYVNDKVFGLNPDVFIATQFGIITSKEAFLEAIKRKKIDFADVHAVAAQCRSCGTVGSSARTRMTVKRGSKHLADVRVQGGTSNLAELNGVDLDGGRFFTQTEDLHSAAVAVIGTDVRDELFGRLDPVGRSFYIQGHPMKVIGVLKKQGSVLGQNQDNQLYIPLSTFLKNFGARTSLSISVRPRTGIAGMAECQDEVRVILRNRRHTAFKANDPFAFVTAEALQNLWRSISATSFAVMTLISGISLLVGGIVITNIMLVSVVERTREIGIRRALGARQRDIQLQFLTEAAMLSLVGGAIGVLIGWIISKIISSATPLPTIVRPSFVVTGLGVALVTGLIAGIFPAVKAAKLPPVEALRYE